jgi:hypothetical protein
MEIDSEVGGGTGTDPSHLPVPVPSSANDVLATVHLQNRCFDRNISSFELNAAIKHGTRTEGEVRNGRRCWKFNYNGITYVTDYEMRHGITAYPDLCWGFDLSKVAITQEMKDDHVEATKQAKDLHSWNSHVVVVVDQR